MLIFFKFCTQFCFLNAATTFDAFYNHGKQNSGEIGPKWAKTELVAASEIPKIWTISKPNNDLGISQMLPTSIHLLVPSLLHVPQDTSQ